MEIVKFNDGYLKDVVHLWNSSCGFEMPYKPFTEEGFKLKFINNPHFSYDGTFVCTDGEKVIGFANALFKKSFLPGETFENTPGYITFVIVDKGYRYKGVGTALLKRAEDYLKNSGKKRSQMDFFNPINLEWYIPGTDRHDHPNAPGVDIEGPGYEFVKKNGYIERTREISMYLDLKRFEIDESILKKKLELKQRGVDIGYYDKNNHTGFDGLFDNLGNELWRKEIDDDLSREKPYPVLVASKNGRICGFAGPISMEKSGRGLFSGIGVDSNCRGMGIGKVLFFMLCDSFRKEGVKFMSIFTGIDNQARKIYEAAGFKIVKTWALFRKEL
ncbi:MAG: GNAT family N-acetyltransferase [Clostridiales bacterium]|nr:GNAT family N-acetyltransferase [Clostridiales bacterium]